MPLYVTKVIKCYTEYAHAGHGSWAPAFRESDEILTWMFQQSRLTSFHLTTGAVP